MKVYTLPVKYSNLSREERREVREQYIKEQNNKCMFCNRSLSEPPPKEILESKIDWSLFPKGFLNYPIHLQHNHTNDLTEGAVHAYCNAYMWQYENK